MSCFTPELIKLATKDVESMIESYQMGLYDKAHTIKMLKRMLRRKIRYMIKNLETVDKKDKATYPILVKELRLERARYYVIRNMD